MTLIFISYAREDLEIAKKVYLDLKINKINAWIDVEDILPGQDWRLAIKNAIGKSDYFFALFSKNSVSKKGFIQKELKIALDVLEEFPENQIYIIPVRIDECNPTYEKINKLQWADLFPSYENGFNKILKSIENGNDELLTKNQSDIQPSLNDYYWHSHKYTTVSKIWKFDLNTDLKTLDGFQQCEREVICLDEELPHLNIYVSKDQSCLPFNPDHNYTINLLEFKRENGLVNILPPHKNSGSRFTFRVNFSPPLIKNEKAYFKYSFELPKFKFGTLAFLREEMKNSVIDARDYEYSSISVNNPIENLYYEINFTEECQIMPLSFEVVRGKSLFEEERKLLSSQKKFIMNKIDNSGWQFKLNRENPPIKTKYRFKWKPR
jgi:hypothetical protein